MFQWELELIRWLQSFQGLEQPMKFFSLFGNEEFFLLAIPFIYWCINSRLGIRVAAILILSTGSNTLAKLIFHTPRPYWIDPGIQALSSETTYSIPSAHAQNALSIWGYLAQQIKQRSWIVAAVIIFLISVSRLYLGMHSLIDVLAGWMIGTVILLVAARWQSQVIDWLAHRTLRQQVSLSFAISMIYFVLAIAILSITPPVPTEWVQQATAANPTGEPIAPRSTDTPTTVAGLIFGYGASLAVAVRQVRFSTGGSVGKRALRFVVGALGTLILWLGLRYATPESIPVLAIVVRYLRYAATIFWVVYGAPRLFIRAGLAESELLLEQPSGVRGQPPT
jgi:membrane-associated phospholipid phosphatase